MQAEPFAEAPTVRSRWAIALEVAAFVAVLLASKRLLDELIWRYAGPASLLATLVLLTGYLRLKGTGWRDLGLARLSGWKARLMVIPQAGLALVAFAAAVAPTTLAAKALDLGAVAPGVGDRWGAVAGDVPHFLLWLAIVWTSAAFGEEMFFRGYLVTRLQQALPRAWFGTVLAVVAPALIFGYGHLYYQGWRGAIVTGAIGLAFGTMFLVFRRNLWPLVLLHGVIDTLTFTAIFLKLK